MNYIDVPVRIWDGYGDPENLSWRFYSCPATISRIISQTDPPLVPRVVANVCVEVPEFTWALLMLKPEYNPAEVELAKLPDSLLEAK